MAVHSAGLRQVPAWSGRTFMRAPSGLAGTAVSDVRPKRLVREAHAGKSGETHPVNGMLWGPYLVAASDCAVQM